MSRTRKYLSLLAILLLLTGGRLLAWAADTPEITHMAGYEMGQTPMGVIYQNPLQSLMIIAVAFMLFVLLLMLVLHRHNNHTRKLSDLLYRDELTGCWNYNQFRIQAGRALKEPDHPDYIVLYVNIAQFKNVNDVYGYVMGDLVLRGVCTCLSGTLKRGEMFARIHSDRMVLLLCYQGEKAFARRCHHFREQLKELCIHQRLPGHIRFLLGAYVIPSDDRDIARAIDRACYAHEKCSKGCQQDYVLYDSKIQDAIQMERDLESDMEQALEYREFCVYYQPKVNSKNGRTVGIEALVRWKHRKYGLLQPSSFISLFETNGMITQIDLYVYREVCRQIHQWKEEGKPIFPVSCNFSRRLFYNSDFALQLCAIADEYEVPRVLLEIEITETMAAEDLPLVQGSLANLKACGFIVAIDDFGAGYSSLGVISSVPFDVIKLDRSLMLDMRGDKQVILQGIVQIVQGLRKQLVCEGVETVEQIRFLNSLDCWTVQGYYYSRPLPIEEFDVFVANSLVCSS